VFDLDLLAQGVIEFGKNSWRGDHFADELDKALLSDLILQKALNEVTT
jgi:hypothetical protein